MTHLLNKSVDGVVIGVVNIVVGVVDIDVVPMAVVFGVVFGGVELFVAVVGARVGSTLIISVVSSGIRVVGVVDKMDEVTTGVVEVVIGVSGVGFSVVVVFVVVGAPV